MNQERIDTIQHEIAKLPKLIGIANDKERIELKDGSNIYLFNFAADDVRLYIPNNVTKISLAKGNLSTRIRDFVSKYYHADTEITIKIYGGSGLKDTRRMFQFLLGMFVFDFTYFDSSTAKATSVFDSLEELDHVPEGIEIFDYTPKELELIEAKHAKKQSAKKRPSKRSKAKEVSDNA